MPSGIFVDFCFIIARIDTLNIQSVEFNCLRIPFFKWKYKFQ